ncbi:hypothetical protein BJ085DRAFT_30337 [Dimargaris cristalligena]|uniref:F-box domain-containing protein n=1 Tax=Dimargaris cristalligena TaxID=215637 RepID=A0A4Q0A3P8_9FUNG|nr:hypothetical protein BJ085DRAFT_30337 [Dimargaris cristalligena]|eukprot:RKP40211.1 hypothetical protein BJ085DRAFT_30337 [Dimargaris cristalligena]
MSSGKFPTFPMGLTGQLHFRSSPGLDLLHFRFHPAQHLLGQRIVRHLSQRDQFQLAQANRELRTPVTSAYQLCIPVGKDAATDDRITETVRRYRPYGRCSSINFHKGVAPGRLRPSAEELLPLQQFFDQPWPQVTSLVITGGVECPDIGPLMVDNFPKLRNVSLVDLLDLAAISAYILSRSACLRSLAIIGEGPEFIGELAELDFTCSTLLRLEPDSVNREEFIGTISKHLGIGRVSCTFVEVTLFNHLFAPVNS